MFFCLLVCQLAYTVYLPCQLIRFYGQLVLVNFHILYIKAINIVRILNIYVGVWERERAVFPINLREHILQYSNRCGNKWLLEGDPLYWGLCVCVCLCISVCVCVLYLYVCVCFICMYMIVLVFFFWWNFYAIKIFSSAFFTKNSDLMNFCRETTFLTLIYSLIVLGSKYYSILSHSFLTIS